MASFEQTKYCPNCKRNVSAAKDDRCKICGGKIERGLWSVRFRYIESDGKEKQKRLSGFSTKKEAQAGYINFVNEINNKKSTPINTKHLFKDIYEEYKSYNKTRLKESSFYDFCSKCDLHILPYFKDFYIEELTPKILLDWQNSKNNYAYKYKTCLRMYLNSILSYAEKYYEIPNKLRNVDNYRNVNNKQEMLFYTPEEFNTFINCISNEIYKTFFYCLYYTGARKGEILASTWNDWDLDKGYFNINKTITRKVFGGKWTVTTPKNQSSIRAVRLPEFLIDIMKSFKKSNGENKFVFYGDKPFADSNIQRVQIEACNKSGVKRIRIHDFRHSHASLLLCQGISVVAVAKRLGHSNIEQTLNTYAHLMPKEDELLIQKLQEIGQQI